MQTVSPFSLERKISLDIDGEDEVLGSLRYAVITVGYDVTPYRPATYWEPSEGGVDGHWLESVDKLIDKNGNEPELTAEQTKALEAYLSGRVDHDADDWFEDECLSGGFDRYDS